MMKITTQKQRLVKLLKRSWISPARAFNEGCGMKLATRAGELRSEGHKVVSRWNSQSKDFKEYKII
jgi:hypothetical protein